MEEIHKINQELDKGNNGNIIQSLPRNMRRRASSYNYHRLPMRIRKRILEKDRNKKPTISTSVIKSPCRKKIRRRVPLFFLSKPEYLMTHLWHAKRCQMTHLWNKIIPLKINQKSQKSCIRALKHSCFIYDMSYFTILQIKLSKKVYLHKIFKHHDTFTGTLLNNDFVYHLANVEICYLIIHPLILTSVRKFLEQSQIDFVQHDIEGIIFLKGPKYRCVIKKVFDTLNASNNSGTNCIKENQKVDENPRILKVANSDNSSNSNILWFPFKEESFLILPTHKVIQIWNCLNHQKCQFGALEDFQRLHLELSIPFFPNDYVNTQMFKSFDLNREKEMDQIHSRKPLSKRINYSSFSIEDPFAIWRTLGPNNNIYEFISLGLGVPKFAALVYRFESIFDNDSINFSCDSISSSRQLHNSLKVIGRITFGGFSFISGKGKAVGFINDINFESPSLVFIRNINSWKFFKAKANIIAKF